MRPAERTLAVVAGIVAGAAGGLFGVGGGILLVPLLVSWMRATQHQAHGTSLAVIGAVALTGIPVYAAHHNLQWREAILVALSSLPSARIGAKLATRTSPSWLTRAFALLLVLVAVKLLFAPPVAASAAPLWSGWPGVAFALVTGVGVGLLAGFMGVGGGIIAVPAFALGLGFAQQAAQGTSLAVILVTAPAGALEHARRGNVLLSLVPWLAIGAALGSVGASWLVQGMRPDWLARAFAVFLLANAVSAWWRATRRSPLPQGVTPATRD
jgi:uncharacterized membrane protein YfcA